MCSLELVTVLNLLCTFYVSVEKEIQQFLVKEKWNLGYKIKKKRKHIRFGATCRGTCRVLYLCKICIEVDTFPLMLFNLVFSWQSWGLENKGFFALDTQTTFFN